MIAIVLQEGCMQTKIIEEEKQVIQLLNHHAYFIRCNNQIHLRIGYGLSFVDQQEIKHGATQIVMDIETKQTATIYYSMYDEGYTKFTHYINPHTCLTIGSCIEDDLYLQEKLIQPFQIQLDLEHGYIRNEKEDMVLSINHKLQKEAKLQSGDLIQIANLQLLYHEDFLMINSIQNLYRNLEPYVIDAVEPLRIIETKRVVRLFKNPSLNTVFEEELMEPMQLSMIQQRPLLFTMGPAITMSFASLASGMVATYNGYLHGRSVYEMLPMLLLPSVMLISSLVWNPLQNRYERKKHEQTKKDRYNEYVEYLTILKKELDTFQCKYVEDVNTYIPCLSNDEIMFDQHVLFQTLPHQNDYLMIRLGLCNQDFDLRFSHHFYFKKTDELKELVDDVRNQYQTKKQCPFVFSLKDYKHIVLGGNTSILLNELLVQLSLRQGADILKFIFLVDDTFLNEHEWITSMQHAMDDTKSIRYVVRNRNEAIHLNRLLENDEKHTYFIIAQKPNLMQAFTLKNVHFIEFETNFGIPANADLIIKLFNDHGFIQTKTFKKQFDSFIVNQYDLKRLFHTLQFYQIETIEQTCMNLNPTFYDLYNIDQVHGLNIDKRWSEHRVRQSIEAVVGLNKDHEQVKIDFHEKGNGPHGLMAGATGSGKSEMLITMLLSLAINYSPSELQFVMIDFKGGGASSVLANESYQIPHMKGILSNLDVEFMERALVSFHNECIKRQRLFKKMSQQLNRPIMNLSSYQENYDHVEHLPYLSALLIVVDEFAELKKEKPEFMNDLISLARIGRSLGMHLLLATQKPSGVVNDQIWSNSRFKICLKVQDAQDSKEMIHQNDASFLKDAGDFYFLCDGMLTRGRSGYANATSGKQTSMVKILDPTMKEVQTKKDQTVKNPTQVELIIQEILAISKGMKPTKQLWLDPLKVEPITVVSSRQAYRKGIYLGQMDDFYRREQPPMYFKNDQTSLLVVSIDRMSKIEYLKSLLYSLLVQTNQNDEIYIIDDLSMPIHQLDQVAQVISIFESKDQERIRNMFEHLKKRNTNCKNECFVIINDFTSFNHVDESYFDAFFDLLEHLEKRKVKLIVFASRTSAITYRGLTLLQNRISLKNENLQELMTLFEQPVHKVVNKPYMGLCVHKNVLEFTYPKTSDAELQKLIQYLIDTNGTMKPYALKTMPKAVLESMNPTDRILLGQNIETYDLCLLDQRESLFVIATYEEEYYAFYKHAKSMNRCVFEYPFDLKTIQSKQEQGVWLFASLDQYKASDLELRLQFKNILYIGPGFKDQYMFVSSYKKPLRKNQAVFFSKGRNQVIQLVE